MKNKFTKDFLPISISLEKIRNHRHIEIPIKLLVGKRYFEYNVSFVIQNYMLVVVLFLGIIALYGSWGDTQNTYIKNLWVQIGQETPFDFLEIEKESSQSLLASASIFPSSDNSPTMELMNLTSSNSSLNSNKTEKKDTKNGLPIFVHSVADYDNLASLTKSENMMEEFMIQKQICITKVLIKNKSSRLDQLNDSILLIVNRDISRMFMQMVLKNLDVPAHVLDYFADTIHLRKIETALMEQVKYNVPVSIKLAQSALETAYGSRVIHNNYFGIKDKKKQGNKIITTEYFTAEEASMNQDIILTQKPFIKKGNVLYECKVQDYFTQYGSAWQSFRGHSEFLSTNKRYAPLFTKGKNYEDWADRIGSERTGGVGYATSPLYGELLKKIIKRYQLHLLDH
ncbi:muramidase (flagellum-specific) [Bernardetia litoralis DSM 6794]|uniref:Muramidase (Flagellum-specific) n=1 Tax=Bernardetia litoralis (strain ATCC 23117 / DSM 6794 / NBRC 15988 / NCIMB 1366 / Fx l1 / Sio-4) TaxID=880071 RepID=I4AG37_BERLS|nr:glucosaminidase domain-containing protein [Bernardetia litoralis]AFM02922.1 muramidase (flagellum-specific) [Bernardetia litoralis DSM 6794]